MAKLGEAVRQSVRLCKSKLALSRSHVGPEKRFTVPETVQPLQVVLTPMFRSTFTPHKLDCGLLNWRKMFVSIYEDMGPVSSPVLASRQVAQITSPLPCDRRN